jgi:Tfp pilus assembly protein PilF
MPINLSDTESVSACGMRVAIVRPSLCCKKTNQPVQQRLLQKTCLYFLSAFFFFGAVCGTSAQNATPYLAPIEEGFTAGTPYPPASNASAHSASSIQYGGNRATLRSRPTVNAPITAAPPSATQSVLQLDIHPRGRRRTAPPLRQEMETYRTQLLPSPATQSAAESSIAISPPRPMISVRTAPATALSNQPDPSIMRPEVVTTPPPELPSSLPEEEKAALPEDWYINQTESSASISAVPPEVTMPPPLPQETAIAPANDAVHVPVTPEPVSAKDEVSVTLYDPTNSQDGVALDTSLGELSVDATTATPTPTLTDDPKNLTPETETILRTLPRDLFPETEPRAKGGFNVKRDNENSSIPSGKDFDDTMSVGANVSVKRQNIDVGYELEKAYNALLQGSTETAIGIYKEILATDPRNKNAMFGLATTYQKLGMLNEARPLYGRLLEIDPYNKEVLNNFLAMVGEEAPESAILYLEQLKASNGEFSPIYAQLAQLYAKAGDLDNAIMNMEQATAISPENLIYTYNLAVLCDRKKDYRRAEVLYRQIVNSGLEGKEIPASIRDIQERLIFLGSK